MWKDIRYRHEAYHPNYGYIIVGSSCIEFLRKKDKKLSSKLLKEYKNISNFVADSVWETGNTKKGKEYKETKYKHHIIRIYGSYAFQIALKVKGERWHDWENNIYQRVNNKSMDQVKELSYIKVRELNTDKKKEKKILKTIYNNTITQYKFNARSATSLFDYQSELFWRLLFFVDTKAKLVLHFKARRFGLKDVVTTTILEIKNYKMKLKNPRWKSVCDEEHTNSPVINEFIEKESIKGFCDYCEKVAKVVDLESLSSFVEEIISSVYEDPANFMSYNSREGGYLGQTYETNDILENMQLETEPFNLMEDIIDSIGYKDWASQSDYSSYKFEYSWGYFKEVLKHKTRYLFYQTNYVDTDGRGGNSIHHILKEIGGFINDSKLVINLKIDNRLVTF